MIGLQYSDLLGDRKGHLGVMAKERDYDLIDSKFELQSRHYIHFKLIFLGKVSARLSSQL